MVSSLKYYYIPEEGQNVGEAGRMTGILASADIVLDQGYLEPGDLTN